MGHSGNPRDCFVLGTKGWEGQRDFIAGWDTVGIPGTPLSSVGILGTPLSSGLRDEKDRGISLLCVGHSDSGDSSVLRTKGWEGQRDFSAVCGTVEIPGTPLSSGLRDGKDRGISVLCVGHSGNPWGLLCPRD